ncbi:MAG: hypothetical protein ACLU3I_08565 [Acutalibacteraceae bacterium]
MLHPHNLTVMIDRLHAVARHPNPELCTIRDAVSGKLTISKFPSSRNAPVPADTGRSLTGMSR